MTICFIRGSCYVRTWVRLEVAVNEGLTSTVGRLTTHDKSLFQCDIIHCLWVDTALVIRHRLKRIARYMMQTECTWVKQRTY